MDAADAALPQCEKDDLKPMLPVRRGRHVALPAVLELCAGVEAVHSIASGRLASHEESDSGAPALGAESGTSSPSGFGDASSTAAHWTKFRAIARVAQAFGTPDHERQPIDASQNVHWRFLREKFKEGKLKLIRRSVDFAAVVDKVLTMHIRKIDAEVIADTHSCAEDSVRRSSLMKLLARKHTLCWGIHARTAVASCRQESVRFVPCVLLLHARQREREKIPEIHSFSARPIERQGLFGQHLR